MPARTTTEVIDRFNQVFADRDTSLLTDLVGETCVMEAIQPAPEGARTEGRDACIAFWSALAEDRTTQFEPEEVIVSGDRATILWRYSFGEDPSESVRGVTLLRVSNGLIVEALGYSKTGDVPLAADTIGSEPQTEGSGGGIRTVREVLDRYNEAFRLHDPELLNGLIAEECVIEDSGPSPDGARREGGQACLVRWSELAANPALTFTTEPAEICGELAVQPWLLHWGDGERDRVRGVNLIRIRDGQIVEARGYVKA